MAFERIKNTADKKMDKLGIKLNCRIWRISEGESWSCDKCREKCKRVVHLNPEDKYSSMLAMQNLQHLLLHEIGHIFFYNWVRNKKSRKLRELFGDVCKEYKRDLSKKYNRPDFISTYAQVHPEDNFCEVFAVYVYFEGDMQKIKKFLKRKKKNNKVLKQFIWMNKFVKKKP